VALQKGEAVSDLRERCPFACPYANEAYIEYRGRGNESIKRVISKALYQFGL
jgi:hypothetical protein